MNFEDVEKRVIKWAEDRLIFEQSGPIAQIEKLQEELDELKEALYRLPNDLGDVVDAIGDMLVVLTMISHMINKDLFTCYVAAYLEIKDRKGKMVDGIFVKEN